MHSPCTAAVFDLSLGAKCPSSCGADLAQNMGNTYAHTYFFLEDGNILVFFSRFNAILIQPAQSRTPQIDAEESLKSA